MCGIAGIVDYSGRAVDAGLLTRMRERLAHRGPDDAGLHVHGPCGLAARRLKVIDLTDRGRMPLANETGTVRVVHNGEIYNFQDLRAELTSRGHRFRSDTDTEVLVHGWEEWGPDCVDRLSGMFAFAIWDARTEDLFLARDRLGVKPLVYRLDGPRFYFASELPALYEAAAPRREDIDPQALDAYLAFGYVPPDRCLLRSAGRLPPGHTLRLSRKGVRTDRYWRVRFRPMHRLGLSEALDETEARLRAAVRRRLVSDVPLGTFLSGGIDSGLVTALAAQEAGGRLRTFSVGFPGGCAEDDERPLARQVAARYGTEHTELAVGPEGERDLSQILYRFGEPFADLSALAVHAISRAARAHITVALSGDGGDESFGGYANVQAAHLAQHARRWSPALLRRAAARVLGSGALSRRSATARRAASWLGQYVDRSVLDHYDLQNHWHQALRGRLYAPAMRERVAGNAARALVAGLQADTDDLHDAERHLYTDLHLRLPGDYLPKVDIASSLVSMEVRSPFLDPQVVEFAARLPLGVKLRWGRQKYLLRRLAARHLPADLVRAPKRGFGPALETWLRTDWAPLVREYVRDGLARREELFDRAVIERTVDEHLCGRANHRTRLWTLLCLEVWWRLFLDRTLTPGEGLR